MILKPLNEMTPDIMHINSLVLRGGGGIFCNRKTWGSVTEVTVDLSFTSTFSGN